MKKKKNEYKPHRYKNLPKHILYVLGMLILAYIFVVLGYSVARPFGKLGEEKPPVALSIESELSTDNVEAVTDEESLLKKVKAFRLAEEEIVSLEDLDAKIHLVSKMEYNTVIIPIKLKGGQLNFSPTYEGAAIAELGNDISLADMCKVVMNAGFTPAVSINALNDNIYPKSNLESGFLQKDTKKLWYDKTGADGKPWLNPSSNETKKYLSAITGEAAAAGFEYILCTDMSYPDFDKKTFEQLSGTAAMEDRYLDLADDVNTMSESAKAKNSKLWLELNASELIKGTAEVFTKPIMLGCDKYLLNIDIATLQKDNSINLSNKSDVLKLIENTLGEIQKKIYKTSFIPEIEISALGSVSQEQAKELLEELGYNSYIFK